MSVLSEDCPYYMDNGNMCDNIQLAKDILDLINRKDAKIAELTEENDLQKAKIEGLQKLVNLSIDTQNEMNDTIINQKAEIERLSNKCEEVLLCHDEEIRQAKKWAKAEAAKEFAQQLKCGVSITSGIITCEDIDNLVKKWE